MQRIPCNWQVAAVSFSRFGDCLITLKNGHKVGANKNLCRSYLDKLVAFATGDKTPVFISLNGNKVYMICHEPLFDTVWEESDAAAARKAAEKGMLFIKQHTPNCPGIFCKCHICEAWEWWIASKDYALKKELETINNEVKRAQEWKGKTPQDVVDAAHLMWLDDQGGQKIEAEFVLTLALQAHKAGLDCSDLITKTKAEIDEHESFCAGKAAEYEEQRKERDLKRAPILCACKKAITHIGWYAASQIPTAESVADRVIETGEEPETAAKYLAELRKAQEGPDLPDTFGFSHGTDFEGGSW